MKSCERCGDDYRPPTTNTKLCPICRIVRDLGSMRSARACDNCEKHFYPIRKSYLLCPECTVIRGRGDVECALCGHKNQLAPGLKETCIFCVSESQKNRASYRKTLVAITAEKIKQKGNLLE